MLTVKLVEGRLLIFLRASRQNDTKIYKNCAEVSVTVGNSGVQDLKLVPKIKKIKVKSYSASKSWDALRKICSLYVSKPVSGFSISGAVYSTSRYGRPVIILNGYRYNRYCRSKGPKAIWMCVKYPNCRATLTTFEDDIIKCKNIHNH